MSEIEKVRALLSSEPRPQGWAERRARLDAIGTADPVSPDIRFESAHFRNVPVEWSQAPGSDASRVLVYFHGGGYCSGSIRSHRRLVSEAGRASGISTLAVEYRLAPEHPYPAALEDALLVYRSLRAKGFAADQIALAGDSAGGGLTLALMLSLREAGEDQPACAWLLSPWTDLRMTGGTMETKDAVDPLIHRAYLEELATAYLAGADPSKPAISPLHADLSRLPPLLIQVGSDETLLDDAVRLAAKAGAADVATTLEIWPHMIHAWPLWAARLEPGRLAIASAARFVRAVMKAETAVH
ncbi:alpha/beta hydrolase [Rhodoligotrophos ferricapiens]|uniref:alpha/beta hydrolase n=1 Tax=Rhodoligotrophos ferricapiens TaxID=3069264 RepID=UPI00315DE5A8